MSGGRFGAILAAAGSGRRFGGLKQFLELDGRPLLAHVLETFGSLRDLGEVVVVGPATDLGRVEAVVEAWEGRRPSGAPPVCRVVAGGERRQDSVRRGLAAFGPGVTRVLVHDAARPLVRGPDVEALMAAVEDHGAAVLGYPATDSVKEGADGVVLRSLDRGRIWLVQTPQGADRSLLEGAYAAAPPDVEFTDEVALLEGQGCAVRLVEGARDNIKVTHPGDQEIAEFLLSRRRRTESPESGSGPRATGGG